MSVTIYVLDTSYLIELFGCGRDSNPIASRKVRELLKRANKSGGRFFVPLPCLFELGDHIADVGHDGERKKLADSLFDAVASSIESQKPWTITPTGQPHDILPNLMERFVPAATIQRIGLVDTFTWQESLRLKGDLQGIKARVHIWTNDRALKSKEPDKELNPYLW